MGDPGRRIGLNPVPDVQTYNTSTPVNQLCQPTQMSTTNSTCKILRLRFHPSGRIMRIFLRALKNSRGIVCVFLMALWRISLMVK